MGPLEEDVGPHGSRMGHREGARTVALSSNGMIYLIVLFLGFLQLCVNGMPALWGLPTCHGGGDVPPVPPGCATARCSKRPRVF